MIEGPGPPITLRAAGAPTSLEPIICWALIRRSDPGTDGPCETHRILLL